MEQRRVNPSMVVLARELRDLTQSELATRLSISQGKISKIESGILPVSDELLAKLSRALDRPESFFFQEEALYGVDTSILYHRKRENVPIKILRRLHAQINIRRIHVTRLLKAADIESFKKFPQFDIDEFGERPDKVAKAVRASWMIPLGPIENVIRAIEDAGGIVMRFDFGTKLIDAVSQKIAGCPPLFFLNSEMPADRERLTLAHELGHIVMHHIINPDIEEQANIFAANFLMPADDIRHSFNVVSLASVAALKPYWRVSMGALLHRARDLGKTSANQYEYLWKQMSKGGYRLREPEHLDIPHEQPRLLSDLIELHRKQLGYSIAQLSQLLDSSEHELRSMYFGQPYLQAV